MSRIATADAARTRSLRSRSPCRRCPSRRRHRHRRHRRRSWPQPQPRPRLRRHHRRRRRCGRCRAVALAPPAPVDPVPLPAVERLFWSSSVSALSSASSAASVCAAVVFPPEELFLHEEFDPLVLEPLVPEPVLEPVLEPASTPALPVVGSRCSRTGTRAAARARRARAGARRGVVGHRLRAEAGVARRPRSRGCGSRLDRQAHELGMGRHRAIACTARSARAAAAPGRARTAQRRGHRGDPLRPGEEHDLAERDRSGLGLPERPLPALDGVRRPLLPVVVDGIFSVGEPEVDQVLVELLDVGAVGVARGQITVSRSVAVEQDHRRAVDVVQRLARLDHRANARAAR